MIFTSHTSPYMKQPNSVSQMMQQVIGALIPGTLVMLWFFGWGVLTNLLLGIGFALALEAVMLKMRGKPVGMFLNDYSAVVTAWLLALAMPAASAWWLLLIAMIFAIVVAKHIYGGLGYNPFNPAMVGYAAVLISYPLDMTSWMMPVHFSMAEVGFADTLHKVFGTVGSAWDAVTMATPLDSVKVGLSLGKDLSTIYEQETANQSSANSWNMINLAYLMGGAWLLYRRIISWHIPAALLAGLGGISIVFWVIDSQAYTSPLFHLFSGGTMLAAFFIATDPVTASTTPTGKLLYAAGIGLFTYIIRTWGGYPDAIAFSVIIMNMAVPLIDYYTQPRVYGHKTKGANG
uniref:Ion-translocating oxidoreductase complex subunit D n=1 Tax=uncultured Thiotrichaceae bacterium TaxID=298394 RepID=A0A6S6TWC4_9GAMM|nr:MAG: Electron transport complex protein RnfD [uncultured Thiotrichaceae bacterium]